MTRYPLRSVLGLLTVITVVLIMGMIFRPTEFAAAFPALQPGCHFVCLVPPEGCDEDQVSVGGGVFCVTCGSAEDMLGQIELCVPDSPECPEECDLLFEAKLKCCQQDSNFDCDGDGNPGGSGSCDGLNAFINDWPPPGDQEGQCPPLTRDQKLQLICCYLQKCSGSGGSSCDLIDCASDILGGLSGSEKKDLEECAGGGGGGGGDCGGGGGGTEEGGGRGMEGPLPGPGECSLHDETQSTPSSGDPVDLFHGDKVETAVDLRVAVSGIDFKLTREYTSNPEFSSSAIIGKHWTASPFRFFTISPPEGPGGCCSQCTGMHGPGMWCTLACFCDPELLPAIIEVGGPTAQYFEKTCTDIDGTSYPVWRLIDPGNWEIDYYRDLDTGDSSCTAPDPDHIGLMAATRDMYGNTKTFHYSNFGTGLNEITRLSWIEIRNQANVEEANVLFYWLLDSSDVNAGKLRRVDVQRPDRTGVPVRTQRVFYTYMDETDPAFESGLGLDGDLIQVVRYERVDPDPGDTTGNPFWRKYVTQYRYHNAWADNEDGDADSDGFFEKGNEHQLRMIFPPEQIEFAAQQQADFDNQPGDVEAFGSTLLTKGDGAVAWDGQTAVKVVDLAAKVLEEYEEWDAANPTTKPGRVKTQYVQSNCGCGGGGTQGKKLTYDYFNWLTGDGRTIKVTEYFKDAPWTLHRTIYHDLDLQGPLPGQGEPDRRTPYLVNKAVIDPGGLKWVTHHEYDIETRTLFRRMTPSAKDTYTEANGSNTPSYTALTSAGLIYEYAYTTGPKDARNHLAAVKVKKGSSGGAIVISQTTYFTQQDIYGRVYLPKRIERIRVEGADPATQADKVEVVEYRFAFHDDDWHDIEWIETKVEAELKLENGPDGPDGNYLSYELFDTKGYNYWSIAADGSYTKRTYDTDDTNSVSATGQIVEILRNSDKTGFPTVSFTDPSHRNGDGGSLKTLYVRDLLGRVQERVTPGQVSTYTLREMRVFPGRTDLKYYAVVTLPHEFGNPAEYDGPGTITWYNADNDVIGSSDYEIKVAHTFAAAPTSQDGYTLIISDYDLDGDEGMETGQLARAEIAHDVSGLVTSRTVWHDIDGLVQGNGQYVTKYFYDSLGRLEYSLNPVRTLTRNTYDVLDRVTKVEIGLPEGPTDDDPDETTIEDIANYIYDGSGDTQGDGNGNLTRVRQLVNSTSTNDRLTDNTYDFRDRLIKVVNPALPNDFLEYDNLDRVIHRGVFQDTPADNHDFEAVDTNRKQLVTTHYSQRGLVYRTQLAIDPTAAYVASTHSALETHSWFDEVGRPVGTWASNGPGTKTTYDGLGRPVVSYTTDREGDADPGQTGNHAAVYDTGTHVAKVNGDVVLEQSQYDYVAGPAQTHAGQMDLVTTLRRTHDAPDATTGDLTLISDPKQAITTYFGTDFDGADRPIKSINFGTNDDTNQQFIYDGTAPTKTGGNWDTDAEALITATAYNSRGLVESSTSPDGDVTMYFFDDLNRRKVVVENHDDIADTNIVWNIPDQTPDRWVVSGVGGIGGELDTDRPTSFVYDGINNVIVQTAHQPDDVAAGDQDQVTEYKYGVATDDNPGASDFHSNDLLRQVIYPDDEIQEADHSVYYAYNRAGELIFTEDQNTTEHTYTRDKLGRVTKDNATDFGTNIDNDIHVITTSYTNYGLVEFVKSLDKIDDVQNAVKFEYNGIWQVTDVHQENNGDVIVGTTLKVQYTYDTKKMSLGNFSRVTEVAYPDGSEFGYGYGATDTSDEDISRLVTQILAAPFGVPTPLVKYDHIGLSMFAEVDLEDIDVQLDRTASHGGKRQTQGNTDNPGLYPGYDRFGRVVRQTWVDGNFTEHATPSSDYGNIPPIVELEYAYDKDSNRTKAYDDRPGGSQTLSHEYSYDGVDRLDEAQRGSWNGSTSTFAPGLGSQRWTLDMLGNWTTIETNEDTAYGYETDEADNRDHDDPTDANELDQRTLVGDGPIPGTDLDLDYTYDKAGNLRTGERSNGLGGAITWTYTHDAWNRLVKVVVASTTKAEYEYNGLNWRIIKRADTPGGGGGLDQQRMMYYSANWQLCEERIDDDSTFPTDPDDADIDRHVQYVWGQRYIDDLILHREDGDVDGTYDDTWYHLTDVQFSTVAILDDAAALVERVSYDAYGQARHHYRSDIDGDGDVDSADATALSDSLNKSIGDAAYNVDADIDRSGTVDTTDQSILNADNPTTGLAKGLLSDPSVDNQIGWDGYVFNAETRQYCVRHRTYDPIHGRWIERDPPEYVDGMNLYEYVGSNPVTSVDPSGMSPDDDEQDPCMVCIWCIDFEPGAQCVKDCNDKYDPAIREARKAMNACYKKRDKMIDWCLSGYGCPPGSTQKTTKCAIAFWACSRAWEVLIPCAFGAGTQLGLEVQKAFCISLCSNKAVSHYVWVDKDNQECPNGWAYQAHSGLCD